MLVADHWKALRGATSTLRIASWPCGDHGSEVHTDLVLSIDAKGIHAVRERFACDESGGEHGPLITRESL